MTAKTGKQAAFAPGDHRFTLPHQGRERSYFLHLPQHCVAGHPLPLVLALHGNGTNALGMMEFCGLNDKADAAGFIVVYPNGTGRVAKALSWNAGNCCSHAFKHRVDDVGFITALLDDVQSRLPVDGQRVYATGMSNGAMMCYRLALELSQRVAAIAPVAGPIGCRDCQPERPVPLLHFHGTADLYTPYAGGRGPRSPSQTDFVSVDQTIATWVTSVGAPAWPRIAQRPAAHPGDLPATIKTWGPGRDGAEVVLVTIEGGGHTWPGRKPTLEFLGNSALNIPANDMLWDFFMRHPLRVMTR